MAQEIGANFYKVQGKQVKVKTTFSQNEEGSQEFITFVDKCFKE